MLLSIDTGHANYAHGSTGGPPVDYFVHAAGDMLHHVHLQDTDGYADRHWNPGEGNVSWPAVFRALRGLRVRHFPNLVPGGDQELAQQAADLHALCALVHTLRCYARGGRA